MKNFVSRVVFFATVITCATSTPQEKPVEQTRFYDFNDMIIDGELQRPEGLYSTERGEAQFDGLLQLDQSFVEEVTKDSESECLE